MNTHSQRFHNKLYSIKQKFPVSRGDNWPKIHQKSKFVDEVMSSKVTKQGKMCEFLTTLIENSALQYSRAMENFPVETGITRLSL